MTYNNEMAKKNIVILGAGFGGLRAAKVIVKKLDSLGLLDKYEVILADRNDHHTHTPLLYEVATTSKTTANIAVLHGIAGPSTSSLIKGLPITFVRGEVEKIDLVDGDVHFKGGRKIKSAYVVLALGSEVNFFGIPGLQEHSLPLKTFQNAIAIRDRVWDLAAVKLGPINIVVGGGGSTGVELAAELREWCGELAREMGKCILNVTILEAAPTVLMGFDDRVISRVQRRLSRLGVSLMANKKISSVNENEVVIDGGEKVPFDFLLWTGGVKAPAILSQMPLLAERGRIVVPAELKCVSSASDLKFYSRVYGLGDNICFHDPRTDKPTPQVAPAAIAQATVVANNIIEDIRQAENRNHEPRTMNYKPYVYPYVVPVGGKYAVAKIGPFVVSGFLGWVFKGLIELRYLLSIMTFARAVKIWLRGLRVFIQNDRLG